MDLFKRLFTTIKDSFFSPALYIRARSARVGEPLSTLAWISVAWALIIAIPAGIALFAFVNSNFMDKAAGVYPAELVITVKDGIASANVEQPYFVDMPGDVSASSSPQYLAVIDTRPDVTVEELTSYDAPVILTQKTLFVADEARSNSVQKMPTPSGSFRPVDLSGVKDYTLDRAVVEGFVDKVRPFVNGFLYILPVLLFALVIGFSVVAYLFLALFGALIVWVLAKFKGIAFDYGTSYVVALYALIPVAIFDLATDLVGVGNYFLLTLALFIGIVLYNVRAEAPAPSENSAV